MCAPWPPWPPAWQRPGTPRALPPPHPASAQLPAPDQAHDGSLEKLRPPWGPSWGTDIQCSSMICAGNAGRHGRADCGHHFCKARALASADSCWALLPCRIPWRCRLCETCARDRACLRVKAGHHPGQLWQRCMHEAVHDKAVQVRHKVAHLPAQQVGRGNSPGSRAPDGARPLQRCPRPPHLCPAVLSAASDKESAAKPTDHRLQAYAPIPGVLLHRANGAAVQWRAVRVKALPSLATGTKVLHMVQT